MEPIYFNQTLRPTRYAFVIKHGDIEAALAAVAINTAIWGGIYNPIVPLEPSEARRGLLWEDDTYTLVDLSGNGAPTDLRERDEHPISSRECGVQTPDGR